MPTNTEVARKKSTRGAILSMLYVSQSSPMKVQTMELALMSENPQISGEMVPAINFLQDRGYIKVIEPDQPEINPMRGVLVRITDRGQDVVEGTIRDESIFFAS